MIVLTYVLLVAWCGPNEAAVANEAVSCAASSLHIWGRFAGKDLRLDRLRDALPHNPMGHSIEEVIQVARQQGISLEICRSREQLPDGCFIVYLDTWTPKGKAEVGHFQVIRPLSVKQRLYQVVEPRASPEVVREEELLRDPRFVGVLLVESPWWRRVLPSLLMGVGILCLTLLTCHATFRIWRGRYG